MEFYTYFIGVSKGGGEVFNDYDNNTDKLIEYLHNCKEWEELNSHERKWMSSNFLLQIFVLIFSLMLITMVYKDKNVS